MTKVMSYQALNLANQICLLGDSPPNPHKKNEIASIGVRPQCGQPSVNLGAY